MCEHHYIPPLREQMVTPLLRVHNIAGIVEEGALIAYYTKSPYHLTRLEVTMEELERAILALRGALEAIRSRGEEPLKPAPEARPPVRPVKGAPRVDEVPF